MTCDGKVMSVTEREVGGIALATGGSPEDDPCPSRDWTLGVVWLGMTYETAWCWRAQRKRYPKSENADVERMRAARRKRWYA